MLRTVADNKSYVYNICTWRGRDRGRLGKAVRVQTGTLQVGTQLGPRRREITKTFRTSIPMIRLPASVEAVRHWQIPHGITIISGSDSYFPFRCCPVAFERLHLQSILTKFRAGSQSRKSQQRVSSHSSQSFARRCYNKIPRRDVTARYVESVPQQEVTAGCLSKLPRQDATGRFHGKILVQDATARCHGRMSQLEVATGCHSKT